MGKPLAALLASLFALGALGCDGESAGTPTEPEGDNQGKAARVTADTANWTS